jgi:hypothetical protein
VELMTLCETGTRAMIGAVFGPPATGETDYAGQLLHLLTPDMLVLADRGFDAAAFLGQIAAADAAFLVRLTSKRRLPVMARLDDGSFLSRVGGTAVRVICARYTGVAGDSQVAEMAAAHERGRVRDAGRRVDDGRAGGHQVMDPGLIEVFAVCYRMGDVPIGNDAYRAGLLAGKHGVDGDRVVHRHHAHPVPRQAEVRPVDLDLAI